jgi:nucleoside-diphosphate-sugar epimerase
MIKEKILVTGASGFIGGWVCEYLFSKGYNVSGTGRRKEKPLWWNPAINYFSLDLTQEKAIVLKFTTIIHVAGLADDQSSYEKLTLHNLTTTSHLLRPTQDCNQFIFISSGSVYSNLENAEYYEHSPIDMQQLSHYGRSKLNTEKYLNEHVDQIETLTIIRPRAVYGERDNTLLPKLSRLNKKNVLLVPGKGHQLISITHIFNLCEAIEKSLIYKQGGIFNIADKQTYTFIEVLNKLFNQGPTCKRIIHIPENPLRAIATLTLKTGIQSSINHQSLDYLYKPFIMNIAKANKLLNYEGRWNLDHFTSKIN